MYLPAPGMTFSSSFSQTTLPPAIVVSTFPCIRNKKGKKESIGLINCKHKAVAMFEKQLKEELRKFGALNAKTNVIQEKTESQWMVKL